MKLTFNIPLHNLRSIAQVEEGLTNVGLLVSTERKMVSAEMTISTKDDDEEIDINTAFTIGQLVGQIQTMAMINQQPEPDYKQDYRDDHEYTQMINQPDPYDDYDPIEKWSDERLDEEIKKAENKYKTV